MKTPDELGINQRTFDALVAVRDKLANGKYIHLTQDQFDEAVRLGRKLGVFNMNIDYNEDYACGTVGCIGGWMGMEMGLAKQFRPRCGDYNPESITGLMAYNWDNGEFDVFGGGRPKRGHGGSFTNPLYELFYPETITDWDNYTTNDAVAAIDYFLKTGDAQSCWSAAVDGKDTRSE